MVNLTAAAAAAGSSRGLRITALELAPSSGLLYAAAVAAHPGTAGAIVVYNHRSGELKQIRLSGQQQPAGARFDPTALSLMEVGDAKLLAAIVVSAQHPHGGGTRSSDSSDSDSVQIWSVSDPLSVRSPPFPPQITTTPALVQHTQAGVS